MSEIAVAMTTAIEPPVQKPRKTKPKPGSTRVPRGPARPYRSLPEEALSARTAKLTVRLEKAKKQHETTRVILTKYAHERFYREKDAILNTAPAEPAPAGPPALPDDPTPPPKA